MVGEGIDARQDYCPDAVRRDAAGWVLGALDAGDAGRFAEHLLTCQACELTVAELQPAAQALLALSPLQPPEHLAVAAWARFRQPTGRTQRSARWRQPSHGSIHHAAGIDISKMPQLGAATPRGIDMVPGPFHS